jgi:hypothetical protein
MRTESWPECPAASAPNAKRWWLPLLAAVLTVVGLLLVALAARDFAGTVGRQRATANDPPPGKRMMKFTQNNAY